MAPSSRPVVSRQDVAMSEQKSVKPSQPAAERARAASEEESGLRVLDYFRGVREAVRPSNLRDWFSRENIIASLKTLAWVAPLTILIWVYAEREQQADMMGQNMLIEVEMPPASGKVSATISPKDKVLIVDLRGPRAQLDAIKSRLSRRDGIPPVRLDLDPNLTADVHDLGAVPLLERSAFFRDYGVRVLNANPPMIRVAVDSVETVEIPVRNPPSATNLEPGTVFDPPSVKFTGPRNLIPSGTPESNPEGWRDFYVYPQGATERLRQAERQEVQLEGLTLRLAFEAEDVTLTPAKVDATFRLKEEDVEYTLGDGRTLPVWLSHPPQLLEEYEVEYDPVLVGVTFIGPPNVIDAIREGTIQPPPKARIELGDADLIDNAREILKPVRYDLPEGVRVSQKDQVKHVSVQLRRRTAD